MKKRSVVLLLAAMLCAMSLLVACGGGTTTPTTAAQTTQDKIIGKWEMKEVKLNGVTIDLKTAGMQDEMSFEFLKSGKANVTALGQTINEIEYKVEGDKITIVNAAATMELEYNSSEDTLSMNQQDTGATVVFKKA